MELASTFGLLPLDRLPAALRLELERERDFSASPREPEMLRRRDLRAILWGAEALRRLALERERLPIRRGAKA